MFSPEEYTHTKPGKGLFQIGCFVAAVFGLCGVVSMTYPDKPSAPREFEGGLERELGGPNALRVSLYNHQQNGSSLTILGKRCWR
jgi:NADH dehydrogenase (ubiquinone) 1 beta subcomplex subunit 8